MGRVLAVKIMVLMSAKSVNLSCRMNDLSFDGCMLYYQPPIVGFREARDDVWLPGTL